MSAVADAAEIPTVEDSSVLLPPTRKAWSRRVPGANIWIYFTADSKSVTFLLVVTSPPMLPHD